MRLIASLVSLSMLLMPAASLSGQGFDVIVLGALGGIQDGNLSSYPSGHMEIATPSPVMPAVWSMG